MNDKSLSCFPKNFSVVICCFYLESNFNFRHFGNISLKLHVKLNTTELVFSIIDRNAVKGFQSQIRLRKYIIRQMFALFCELNNDMRLYKKLPKTSYWIQFNYLKNSTEFVKTIVYLFIIAI